MLVMAKTDGVANVEDAIIRIEEIKAMGSNSLKTIMNNSKMVMIIGSPLVSTTVVIVNMNKRDETISHGKSIGLKSAMNQEMRRMLNAEVTSAEAEEAEDAEIVEIAHLDRTTTLRMVVNPVAEEVPKFTYERQIIAIVLPPTLVSQATEVGAEAASEARDPIRLASPQAERG